MRKPAKLTKAARRRRRPTRDEANHHLVANRGFWWVCCSINATPRTKEKLGFSLGTKSVETARLRRDTFLNGLHAYGLEVRIRRHSPVYLDEVAPLTLHANMPWQKRVEYVLAVARTTGVDDDVLAIVPTPKRRRRAARSVCCV